MNIYYYDSKTGEYLSTGECEADPQETKDKGYFVPLVPAYATLLPPGEYEDDEVAVFQDNSWVIKTDYRNYMLVDDNLTVSSITTIDKPESEYVVNEATAQEITEYPDKFKIVDGAVVKKTDAEYQAELAQKEALRVAQLNLTGADLERAIYKAKGMDFNDVIAQLETLKHGGQSDVQGDTSGIDIKALKIELKANNFYRGNPYIDAVGTLLGFTKQQLDEFFETNDYTKLL